MHLFNVRKGQFVYFDNQLHQVYAVKPFFRQSVHLIRLSDFEQILATAKEIDLYRPKHLDSFVYNRQRYTLHKEERAQVGDYILVINPKPDSLDHHYLHAIESVAKLEDSGVITNRQNGINHSEYWVMKPGKLDDATIIDLQVANGVEIDESIDTTEALVTPQIGDIFQKSDSAATIQAMVVAIDGDVIYLGNRQTIDAKDLLDNTQWVFVNHVKDNIIE